MLGATRKKVCETHGGKLNLPLKGAFGCLTAKNTKNARNNLLCSVFCNDVVNII